MPSRIRQNEDQDQLQNSERGEAPVFYPGKDEFGNRRKLPDLSRLEVTSFMNNANGQPETLNSKNLNSVLYKSLTR